LGFVPGEHVYACPQSLFKFHPEFDPMLGEILRRDPKGVLVLQHGMSPVWHGLLLDRFERSIPDVVDRIRWLPGLSHDMYLALLAESEVTLDPIHFGGGNTTYEMLSLGTPVVTLPGQFLRSRISRALYTKAGYDNLIVADAEEYVEKAVALGTDPAYRREVSAEILERCDVLYDDLGEIRDLEDFFESIVL
jgi:predicted O-linked N-acetylglucosamine transferase (SPINDLY family)